jgi:Holliday junction resolvasome RuvABC endonuclease subunit
MRVVGIDVGSNITGVCFMFPSGKHKVKVIDLSKSKLPYWERYKKIIEQLKEWLIKDDIVLIEDYAHSAKSASSSRLIEIGGMVRFVAWQRTGLYPLEVNIGTLKSWARAKKKNQVLKQVLLRWKKNFNDDNEADAFVVADFGIHFLSPGYRTMTQHDKTQLKNFRKRLHAEQMRFLIKRGYFDNVDKFS